MSIATTSQLRENAANGIDATGVQAGAPPATGPERGASPRAAAPRIWGATATTASVRWDVIRRRRP